MPEIATHTPGWKRLSILIIDDERPARSELERMLRGLGHEGPLAQASSAAEALERLGKTSADLILLDIQMPGGDGFSLLSSLGKNHPAVIFTTAHASFAVRAFEEEAVDYLLKPFSPERLAKALNKVTTPANDATERLGQGDLTLLKVDGECLLVDIGAITMFESEGNFTRIRWNGRTGLLNKTLHRLEEQLDPDLFFRASRSLLINISHVISFSRNKSGMIQAVIRDHPPIEFSRRQSSLFLKSRSL